MRNPLLRTDSAGCRKTSLLSSSLVNVVDVQVQLALIKRFLARFMKLALVK